MKRQCQKCGGEYIIGQLSFDPGQCGQCKPGFFGPPLWLQPIPAGIKDLCAPGISKIAHFGKYAVENTKIHLPAIFLFFLFCWAPLLDGSSEELLGVRQYQGSDNIHAHSSADPAWMTNTFFPDRTWETGLLSDEDGPDRLAPIGSYEVQSITAIPKGWPQGEPLPEIIKIAAGAIDSPAHQADIKINVLPAMAGIPVFVKVINGLGHEAGKNAKLKIGTTVLEGEGAGAFFMTPADGVIKGVLTSSDVVNDCTVQACRATRLIDFTWDEFGEKGEWTNGPLIFNPMPGETAVSIRLSHHRLGAQADVPRRRSDQHRIRFFVEEIAFENMATKYNKREKPSDLSEWAYFPNNPSTTDAEGVATTVLTIPTDVTNIWYVSVAAYDWGVYREPTAQESNALQGAYK